MPNPAKLFLGSAELLQVSFAEIVWSFALLGLLLIALRLFVRFRRGTTDYRESRTAKDRLPSWVRAIERLALYAIVLTIGGLVFVAFSRFSRLEGEGRQTVGATAIYLTVGAALIASPVGALMANLVSWFLPPLRRANDAAMAGTHVSFASANRGLLQFATVSVPVGIIAVAMAAFAPWAR